MKFNRLKQSEQCEHKFAVVLNCIANYFPAWNMFSFNVFFETTKSVENI